MFVYDTTARSGSGPRPIPRPQGPSFEQATIFFSTGLSAPTVESARAEKPVRSTMPLDPPFFGHSNRGRIRVLCSRMAPADGGHSLRNGARQIHGSGRRRRETPSAPASPNPVTPGPWPERRPVPPPRFCEADPWQNRGFRRCTTPAAGKQEPCHPKRTGSPVFAEGGDGGMTTPPTVFRHPGTVKARPMAPAEARRRCRWAGWSPLPPLTAAGAAGSGPPPPALFYWKVTIG